MSEHNRGAWGVREDGNMWWPGSITAADQQSLQQHQQILHQQQQLAAQQLQSTSASAPTQQQIFSYKMASSFQNPQTTISNVSSTSPIGAAGIRGYDYRLGGGMGGNPTMTGPTPASQWWYPSAMDSSMQNNLQNNIQNNMQPVHTPPPVSQGQLNQQQVDAQRQQQNVEAQRQVVEAHRQQAVEAQRQQHHEAQRQQHEAHRQHQEAQRQYQEAQAHLHQQVVEAQARQAQLQQAQEQVHQQAQLAQQVQNQQLNHQNNQSLQQQILNLQAPIPQKGRMPRAKADAKPRGRMTAYAFFVQTCREEHKKKHPDENVVFAEFSKKCAERWKTMLDKEKKRFHEMAEKDKKRYDAEMQNYTPPKGEKQRGKKRKQVKDPNAPKRSLSAFFWFCNDERGKVKGANPEYGVGDIAKELGRRWADADSETKGRYEQMAEKDKARYEKEMTAYKMKNNPALQPVAVPEHDEEEEEEEVDDDDDDD